MHKKSQKLTLIGILDILSVGLLIVTLFGFLGGLWWFFDLFSHFRVQYMQLCLPLIGIALWKRLNKRAAALAILACLNYALVLPLYFGKPAPASTKPTRAMLMNLLAENGNTDQVLSAIQKATPDILLLEEVTPKWADELSVLHKDYEYRMVHTRSDSFGIMLMSKFPLKNAAIKEIGNAGLPSITAEIYMPSGEISFIGTQQIGTSSWPPCPMWFMNRKIRCSLSAISTHHPGHSTLKN
jgi:endonuclease/exonuclease/phosphatase (EEP) superfamily protein YafD